MFPAAWRGSGTSRSWYASCLHVEWGPSSSCHVTSPAPFTGGLATCLSLFFSPGSLDHLSAGRPEHTQRGRDELGSSSISTHACSQPRRAGASVFFSQVPGGVYWTHDVFGRPCRFVGCQAYVCAGPTLSPGQLAATCKPANLYDLI